MSLEEPAVFLALSPNGALLEILVTGSSFFIGLLGCLFKGLFTTVLCPNFSCSNSYDRHDGNTAYVLSPGRSLSIG